MDVYHKTLTLPAGTIDRLEQLCRGPATDCGSDETVFDHEVTFDDGRRMAIQVVAPNDPAESCWTQGVLFEAGGAELGCTEPGDAFAGDYEVCCDGNVYSVRVAEDSMERWAVLYRDGHPVNPPECFMAWAEDSDHAEEQCADAYPGCEVLWTFQGDANEAFADYWGE